MSDGTPLDEEVIVVAPFGRDELVITSVLGAAGVGSRGAKLPAELAEHVHAGVGAVLLTQEALTPNGVTELLRALSEQPTWSELPVLLLLAPDEPGSNLAADVTRLASARNVTVLQRPLPAVTLSSAVQCAMSARRRQYQVRDLIAREQSAREQAEEATRVKDEFLALVSHELRTPLSAVLIWAQLLEAGKLDREKTALALDAIVSGAKAQSRLIEDLLDVSRMVTGKLCLDLRPQALSPSLLAALRFVRPTADAKGVRLEVQLEASGDRVILDADRAQQIFWNLLSNAVKFTPRGGCVSVRLVREEQQLAVTVADTGQGIRPELLPHVFERFRQGDRAAARRHGGLGLGLSLVKYLVESHGGRVSVTSDGESRGATFIVRLPVAVTSELLDRPLARADDPDPP